MGGLTLTWSMLDSGLKDSARLTAEKGVSGLLSSLVDCVRLSPLFVSDDLPLARDELMNECAVVLFCIDFLMDDVYSEVFFDL